MDLHCTRCHIALPPESERCPRCLRTSTLVDRDARRSDPELELTEEPGESYPGLRSAVLAGAWALAALVSWLILPKQEWLESHRLWLAGLVWVGALWTLPLRAAFRAPKTEAGPREALRALAVLTTQLMGLGSLFALTLAGICQLTDSVAAALVIGLALFVSVLLVAPAVSTALHGEKRLAEVLPPALGRAGLAILCVGALMAVAVLRGSRRREEATIVIPTAPEALQEIVDAQNVPVTSARITSHAGVVIHLRADGGTFERTLLRLKGAALSAMSDLKNEPRVALTLWFPARFEAVNGNQARDEIKELSDALAHGSSQSVTLEAAFGEPPRQAHASE